MNNKHITCFQDTHVNLNFINPPQKANEIDRQPTILCSMYAYSIYLCSNKETCLHSFMKFQSIIL